jgi:hypothetical protein
MICVGAEYGIVGAKELLPSRTKMTRTISDLAAQYRIDSKEDLFELLNVKAFTIISDFALDKFIKQSALDLNGIYANSSYQYKAVDLLCRPFNDIKSYDLIL